MAKTGFWLRGAQGKLAGATVYKSGSDTVMREIVTPANPRTDKQLLQRIIMNTVMAAYSFMKDIADHSFEGVKAGRDTMAYFMKQNIQFARDKIRVMQEGGTDFISIFNFTPLGSRLLMPNQYQVSMGSLPQVTTAYSEESGDFHVPALNMVGMTYAQIINKLGLMRGDQLTFIGISGQPEDPTTYQFHYSRVILDPTGDNAEQLPLDTPFLDANGRINKPSFRNEGEFKFTEDAINGLNFHLFGGFISIGACVVVSRQVNDTWLRSTTYLTYDNSEITSLGECLNRSKNGVQNPIYQSNSRYLNNAGEGGGIAAETGGGGTPYASSITAVQVGTQPVTNGTTRNVYISTYPTDLEVKVTVDSLPTNGKILIKKGSNVVKQADIAALTTSIDLTFAKAADTGQFQVVLSLDGVETASSWSFSIQYDDNGD